MSRRGDGELRDKKIEGRDQGRIGEMLQKIDTPLLVPIIIRGAKEVSGSDKREREPGSTSKSQGLVWGGDN